MRQLLILVLVFASIVSFSSGLAAAQPYPAEAKAANPEAGKSESAKSEAQITLPKAMAWSAYNLGTTGYNQAVGISKMLKDRHRVTLRVIPGKNDVSRLLPLMVNRVQFSANGVATYFAQEGAFQFASQRWGPVPIRMVMMSVGFSNQAIAVTEKSGIKIVSDLRGKRVPYVRGAPSLNVSTEAQLACGGLGWDDVTRVEYPGYNAMWNGIVDGQIDVAYATTVSGPTRKLEASPRGIHWLPIPHDDEQCWQQLLKVGPYFTKHIATRGAGISDATPHEGATYPYPMLVTLASQDKALVRNLASAIHLGFEDFRHTDPGSEGWALERQQFDWVVPFHEGAIEHFKSLGVWGDIEDIHNNKLLERQTVLQEAWRAMLTLGIQDDTEFRQTWMKVRAIRLREKGFDPIWE
ncbi:MAG: TRAP transporter TAXI family solute receptor [Patiriisocius sp.]|jgi:TRAP transporter TAXI family solute receptor